MGRNANKPRRAVYRPVSHTMLRSGTALVAQNPVLVGGTTAFLLTLFFVSANAVWYQPHSHPAALFQTRTLKFEAPPEQSGVRLPAQQAGGAETVILIEREDREEAPVVPADPTIQKVQSVLSDLNLYTGSVDGIPGPKTRDAIRNYRRILGLKAGDEIDKDLLDQLGAKPSEEQASVAPLPENRPDNAIGPAPVSEAEADIRRSEIVRIQAGLRAFGNDQIEIDGMVGPKTELAIREFQSLFGMEVNGKAGKVLLSRMQELGFVN